VGDLFNSSYLKSRIEQSLVEKNVLLKSLYGAEAFDPAELTEKYLALGEKLKAHVADANVILHDAVRAKKKILFEGAQGAMLDIDQGTYPFVTSSNTTSGGATTGTGLPPSSVNEVIAIVKAYTTRVGTGPFPTEQLNEVGDRLQSVGAEFGATTGRRRRCGWLDLVVLRHSRNINGFTGLAITKLDVLTRLKVLQDCTDYEYKGKKFATVPADLDVLEHGKPVYKTLKAWNESVTELSDRNAMPAAMRDYLSYIEQELEVKSVLLSVGPDRKQTLELRNPFGG
jgi:adenylosuccinate synthase